METREWIFNAVRSLVFIIGKGVARNFYPIDKFFRFVASEHIIWYGTGAIIVSFAL